MNASQRRKVNAARTVTAGTPLGQVVNIHSPENRRRLEISNVFQLGKTVYTIARDGSWRRVK